jgi:hypothetical protein
MKSLSSSARTPSEADARWLEDGFLSRSIDYLLNRELFPRWILTVQQGGGNPGFIGNLDLKSLF